MARKSSIKDVILFTFTFSNLKIQMLGFINEQGEKCYKIKCYYCQDLCVDLYDTYENAFSSYRSRVNHWLDMILFDHYNSIV